MKLDCRFGLAGAAGILAAALLVPACDDGDVGEGDQLAQYTVRVSKRLDGTQSNESCRNPNISGDGRFVVFCSECTSLVTNDNNNCEDIFVQDRTTGAFENSTLLSTPIVIGFYLDNYMPALSADGRYVVFASVGMYIDLGIPPTVDRYNLWRYDRQTGKYRPVIEITDGTTWPDENLSWPSISADGRYVAFESAARNIVTVDGPVDSLGVKQIWVADFVNVVLETDLPDIRLVSRASAGPTVPADADCANAHLSGDGSTIVFQSAATNLVNTVTGNQVYLGTNAGAACELVSEDGATPLDGDSVKPSVSADGRYVAFYSFGSTGFPADAVLRRDRTASLTEVVADDAVQYTTDVLNAIRCSISGDGRRVVYMSDTIDLASIRMRDMAASGPVTVSIHRSGAPAALTCERPAISADGAWVVWQTYAANLVPDDTNGLRDIYLRGPYR